MSNQTPPHRDTPSDTSQNNTVCYIVRKSMPIFILTMDVKTD